MPTLPIKDFAPRNTSGLVRQFRFIDAFIFNTAAYSLGLVLTITPTFLGSVEPTANIYAVLLIGLILTAFNGVVYALFASAMKSSGGDYIYISRSLHPALGFVANWGFTCSQIFGLGVYATWAVTTALSPGLVTFGYVTGSTILVALGQAAGRPAAVATVGSILLLSVLGVTLVGMARMKRIMNAMFVVAMVGTLVMVGVFVGTTHDEFARAFNAFMQSQAEISNAYEAMIQLARTHGLVTGRSATLSSALLALPVGYWVFIGFNYSAYVGAEVKEADKNQLRAILGALAFGFVAYMIGLGQYYAVVGRDFNNALAIVQALPNTPLPAGGSMSSLAGILVHNPLLNILISFGTFVWFWIMLVAMAIVSARNICAWSLDGVVPKSLGTVTDRTATPVVATVVTLVLAEIVLLLQVFVGLAFINYIALFSVCFLIAGIAAIAFPYRRRDLFNAAPPLVRRKIAGVPLIVIAGVGNSLLFLLVLYSALTNSGISGVRGWIPLIAIFTIYGSGALIYFQAKRRGLDLVQLHATIPDD